MKSNKLVIVLDASADAVALSYWTDLLAKYSGSYTNIYVLWIGDARYQELYITHHDHLHHIHLPLPGVISSVKQLSAEACTNYAARVTDLLILSGHFSEPPSMLLFHNSGLSFLAKSLKERIGGQVVHYADEYSWGGNTANNYTSCFLGMELLADTPASRNWSDKQLMPLKTATEETISMIADMNVYSLECMKQLATRLYQIPEEKMRVVSKPYPMDIISTCSYKRDEQRKSLGIGKTDQVLLFYGDFTDESGIFLFLKALHPVLATHDSLKIIITGKGNLDLVVKAAGQFWSRLIFAGSVSMKQLGAIAIATDLAISIPLKPTPAAVYFEMLQLHIPLLVSASSGITSIDNCKHPVIKLALHQPDIKAYLDTAAITTALMKLLAATGNSAVIQPLPAVGEKDRCTSGLEAFENIFMTSLCIN